MIIADIIYEHAIEVEFCFAVGHLIV